MQADALTSEPPGKPSVFIIPVKYPCSLILSSVPFLCLFTVKLGIRASLVAQRLKRLPAMQETWVQSLGWEDPLEKEMATHSSILAWRSTLHIS